MTKVLSVIALGSCGFALALMLGSTLGMLATDRAVYAVACGFGFAALTALCLAWEGRE